MRVSLSGGRRPPQWLARWIPLLGRRKILCNLRHERVTLLFGLGAQEEAKVSTDQLAKCLSFIEDFMHKKIVGLTLLATAMSASAAQAQGPITQIGVGVFGQYTKLDDKLKMDNVGAIGGRIGVSVYKWLGVEADIQYGPTKANRAPWQAFGAANPDPLNNQVFQLYNLGKDFNQTEDIAAQNPQKVKEMRQKFLAEAKKYQVLPLDASVAGRIVAPRPNITAGRTEFVYTRPMVGLPQGDSPFLLNSSYTITADITVPQGGAEGMILTSGGRFAGYGFYLLKGKPVFLWNLVDLKRIKWEGPDALTPGQHTLEFDFKYDGLGVGTLAFNNMSGLGRPGTGVLKVDGKVVQTITMEKTLPMILQWDESFDIGSDTLTGVNDADYKPPFALTAKLNKLTIKVDRPQLSPADIQKLEAAMKSKD